MRLKPSKAQPPATRHKLLGVVLEILDKGIRLSPAPERVQKVLSTIGEALAADHLEPVVAQRLAGKLNFLSTTLFGQAAASALKPLYSRAHDRNFSLNGLLRCSLRSLQMLLRSAEPRWMPFHGEAQESAVVYADACFELGDQAFGLSDDPRASGRRPAVAVTRTAGALCCGERARFDSLTAQFHPKCCDCLLLAGLSFIVWRSSGRLS